MHSAVWKLKRPNKLAILTSAGLEAYLIHILSHNIMYSYKGRTQSNKRIKSAINQ